MFLQKAEVEGDVMTYDGMCSDELLQLGGDGSEGRGPVQVGLGDAGELLDEG